MNIRLKTFKTAFLAEHIKKRGTGIYTIAAIMGVIVPILLFVFQIIMITQGSVEEEKMPYNYYMKFVEEALTNYAAFFFPVLIIINASRIAQLDHKNGGWQLMEIQPLQKKAIYFSKFSVLLISTLLSILACVGISLLLSWLLTFYQEVPAVAIIDFPFSEIVSLSSRIFLAAFVITSLQYFLAVLIPGFVWSMLIGFLGIIVTPVLSVFKMIPDWFPFQILNLTKTYKEGSDIGNWFLYTEKLSFVLGVLFLLIGYTWYSNKTFKRAFLSSFKKIVTSFGVLSFFGLITAFLMNPNSYELHNKTIIAGKIESDSKFQEAYLIHPTIGDTLAVIKIKDNAFSQEIKNDLPLDQYQLAFKNSFSLNLTLSNRDSIFAKVQFYNNSLDVKCLGTRLAENQFKEERDLFDYSPIPYYLGQNIAIDDPDRFLKELYSAWEKKYDRSGSFKTRDNFIPKPDFIELSKKMVCVEYLTYLNQFLEKRKALYPKEKTILTEDVKKIQSKISLYEESLIGKEKYLTYLLAEITRLDTRDIDKKSKEIEAISKLEPSRFKNRLLFFYLKNNLEEAGSSDQRKALVTNYTGQIQDQKLVAGINNYYKVYERLGKGNVARDFVATSIDGKPVQLSAFKGKFVAIDLWATWCGPCKYQSSYFEEMAIKYKKENIQFVALSLDKDLKNWFVDAKSKSKSVLQLHANDIEAIGNDYNVSTIPRFILIDAEGKIFNSKMPFPNESSFEFVLRKALKLNDLE
ncbi:MAG: redoxin family protein [Flavobacterium sp.]